MLVPTASLATFEVARANMMASTAVQPISTSSRKEKTMARVVLRPSMLRMSVYCSTPYLPDGTHVARQTMAMPIALPMIIAAMPALAPTNAAVAPPVRNAHVAMARPMFTQVKSPKPQTRSCRSTGRMPNVPSRSTDSSIP